MTKKEKPIGVTLGWDAKVHLCFKGGYILYGDADKILYPQYWQKDSDWPHDPITGNKLKIKQ